MGIRTISNIKIINKTTAAKKTPGGFATFQRDYHESKNISPLQGKTLKPAFAEYQKIALGDYLALRRLEKKSQNPANLMPKNDDEKVLYENLVAKNLLRTNYRGYSMTPTGMNLLAFYKNNKLVPFAPDQPSYGLDSDATSSNAFLPSDKLFQSGDAHYTVVDRSFNGDVKPQVGEFIEIGEQEIDEEMPATPLDTLELGKTKKEELSQKFSGSVLTGHPVLFDIGSGEIILAVRYEKSLYYISTPKRYFNYLYRKHSGNIKIEVTAEDIQHFSDDLKVESTAKGRPTVSVAFRERKGAKILGYLQDKSYLVIPNKKHFADIENCLKSYYSGK